MFCPQTVQVANNLNRVGETNRMTLLFKAGGRGKAWEEGGGTFIIIIQVSFGG